MAVTRSALRESFSTFLGDLGGQIANSALDDVPVLGGLGLPAGRLAFATLASQIDAALASAADTPAALLAALNNIDGITATLDGQDFVIAVDVSEAIALVDVAFDAGASAGAIGLAIDGSFATTLQAAFDADLRVNGANSAISIEANGGADELTLSLESNLNVEAEADLGFIDLSIVDADPDAPEITLQASIDLATGLASNAFVAPLDVDFTGTAALAFDVETALARGLLPGISAEISLTYDLDSGVPTIVFKDVSIDIGTMLGVFGEIIADVADVLDEGTLGRFLDFLTGPLPVIDAASAKAGFDGWLDTLPTLVKDGDISLADLAYAFNSALESTGNENPELAQMAKFFEVIGHFDLVRDLFGDAEGGKITLGTFTVTDNPLDTTSTFVGIDPQQALDEFNQWITDSGIVDEIEGFDDIFTEELSVNIPLLENPELIVNVLFNQLFDPVTIIELDIPKLEFDASVDLFFRLLGPVGVGLRAGIGGLVDLDFGYDTLSLETGDILDGIYLASLDDAGQPDPDAFVVTMNALLAGTAGVDIGIASVKVVGGVNFLGFGFLKDADDDGRSRLADLGQCILDNITGRAWANLGVEGRIGLGPFSAKKTFTIAKAEFANFTYTVCEPGVSPKDLGLADWVDGSNPANEAGDLVLHTGAQAIFRVINGVSGNDLAEPEYYQIGNAIDHDTGLAVAGRLAVHGFGVSQEYGNTEDDAGPVNRIVGDLGALDDSLIVAPDVTQTVEVGGGDGDDFISSGAGNDRLGGGEGADHLIGNDGDDLLSGGGGDDRLDGGAGADTMIGGIDFGPDFDEVSYEDANLGTGVGVRLYWDGAGFTRGFGGEAEGDQLYSIEQVTGTLYDDELTSGDTYNLSTFQFVGKTLFGLEGNDRLIGGRGDDFLLGGAGGDVMIGGDGHDATSYAFSNGAVYVDLQFNIAFGGEAEGDFLQGIESTTGSAYADAIYGSSGENYIDGLAGDDVIDGRGGTDRIFANLGNDTVYAYGNGATIDGGGIISNSGRDLLSFRNVGLTGIVADLGAGIAIANAGSLQFDVILNATRLAADGSRIAVAGTSSFEDLDGSLFDDALTGDNGDNRIQGLSGADTISGGGGYDRLVGGDGADRISGGEGLDWVEYRDSNAGVTVRLDGTPGIGGTAEGDVIDTVENILGSDHSDQLYGTDSDNVIDVGLSDTSVADVAEGGGGADILIVDYSRDDVGGAMTGGYAAGSTLNGGFVRAGTTSPVALDSVDFTGFERLFVTGTRLDDTIYAGVGDDRLATGGGTDVIYASQGNDYVAAGAGDDFVSYGADINRNLGVLPQQWQFFLDGGTGIDTLSASLTAFSADIALAGSDTEFGGVNLALPNGAAIRGFEILGDILTGDGDDTLTQTGVHNNRFLTADGSDTIASGLGIDSVDGGFSTEGVEIQYADGAPIAIDWTVKDEETFRNAKGDTLVLDYSTQDAAVRSIVSTVRSELDPRDFITQLSTLRTNEGVYYTRDDAAPGLLIDQVAFREIEQVDVTGSRLSDVLVGTDTDIVGFGGRGVGYNRFDTVRGSDILRGMEGNDRLIGYSGNDILAGGDGDDELRGSWRGEKLGESTAFVVDKSEFDDYRGGAGADTFVLGDAAQADYVDLYADVVEGVDQSFALIRDFNAADGDTIVLHGSAAEYSAGVLDGTGYIHKIVTADDNYAGFIAIPDSIRIDLIAVIENVSAFDHTAAYVRYEDDAFNVFSAFTPLMTPTSVDLPLPANLPEIPDLIAVDPVGSAGQVALRALDVAAATAPWVTQSADTALLLEKLGTGTGIVAGSASLTIDGSSEGFGWFEGDPFGLGGGIVLSTGRVEDLDAPNTTSGLPGATARPVPLAFEYIGSSGNSAVYRVDLSNLGIDINSIRLSDAISKEGGQGGSASGFDIDALVISSTRLESVTNAMDLNDAALLPRLDVIGYDNARLFFEPGSQRSPAEAYPFRTDLLGSVNGMVIDPAQLIGRFSRDTFNPDRDWLSLGDGGSLSLDLTQTLKDGSGPLYLYVGESGGNGEAIIGEILASSDFTVPTGDLSSDLGAPGLDGDTSTMTYSFTPAEGSDYVTFEVVIFSEELPEHAGINPADLVKVTLNGMSIASLSDGQSADLATLMPSPVFGAHPDLVLNPAGTGPLAGSVAADGYTKTLTFAGRVQAGIENTLVIEAADTRDAWLDTGILVKGGTFLNSGGALPDNAAPVAIGEMFKVLADSARAGNVVANDIDPDGDALEAALLSGPSHGTLTFNEDGSFVYTPETGFTGSDSFAYSVSDGALASGPAIVTLLVEEGENTAPTTIELSGDGSVPEDAPVGAVVGTLSTDDPDGQPITYTISEGSPFAIVGDKIIVANELDYETQAEWTVTVTADDGEGGTTSETFTIEVLDVDDGEQPAAVEFSLAKTSVAPGGAPETWRNPLSNLVYALAGSGYVGPSSPVDDPTGPSLARFAALDGDMTASRIEFDGAEAVDPEGDDAAMTLEWTGGNAVLRLAAPWNSVENIELDDFVGSSLSVVNFANVVADWSDMTGGRSLTVEGAKRGIFDLGSGGDTLVLLASSNTADATDHFDIDAGGGDDIVVVGVSPTDHAGLAFGTTYDPSATTVSVELGEGHDYFVGGAGMDTASGGGGRDTLIGNGGADSLDGGAGADVLLGGVGDDRYLVDDGLDLVDEGAVFPSLIGSAFDHDVITSTADWFWDVHSVAETLIIAVDAADPEGDGTTIVGSVFSNMMIGNAGTNVLFGRGGSDTYRAGDGLDFISLSTLGVDEENGYVGVDGANTIIVERRQSGENSYDVVYEFETGKDRFDVTDYGYETAEEVYATGKDDGYGSSYFILGDGKDYIFLVGTTLDQVSAGDFIV